jgi:Zn-dependent membrane protease YugP
MHGMEKVAIETSPKTGIRAQSVIPQLYLEKNLAEGKDLLSISRCALEAVFALRWPHTFLSQEVRSRLWDLLHLLIALAWILLLLSSIFPWAGGGAPIAFAIFLGVFLFSLLDLPIRWEATRQAFDFLKQSRYFDIDELVEIKNLLRGMRLEDCAQIFKTPLGFFKKWLTKI